MWQAAATKPEQSANLDLLRSFAVLSVLLGHTLVFLGDPRLGPLSPRHLGGFGVLLFFVHTCLVLMSSLERQERKYGSRRRFAIFMTRRVFRIYPLSVLVVLAIIAFRVPSAVLRPGSMTFLELPWHDYAANLLLIQNLVHAKSVLGPLWSLPYEIQMYLFLPAIYVLLRRASSLPLLLAAWLLTVPTGLLEETVPGIPMLAAYVPCFIPGVIAYWLSTREPALWPAWAWPLVLVVLTVAYVAHPVLWMGYLACLLTGLLVVRFREVEAPWVRGAAHLVATYSYGIYLTHYFVIRTAFGVLKDQPAVVQAAAFVTLGTLLPVLLYHAIEAPMIRVGNRFTDRFVAVREPLPARYEESLTSTGSG